MKWKLRWAAAKQDIWRPTELLAAFKKVGFEPSLSKTAALWSGKPVTVRLDDLDKICAALGCTVADLLEPEPVEMAGQNDQDTARAVGRPGSRGRFPAKAPQERRPPVTAAELTGGDAAPAYRAVPRLPGLGNPDPAAVLLAMPSVAVEEN